MTSKKSCLKLARQIMELVAELYNHPGTAKSSCSEDDAPDHFLTTTYRSEIVRIFALDGYRSYGGLSRGLHLLSTKNFLTTENIHSIIKFYIANPAPSGNSVEKFHILAYSLCTFACLCFKEGRVDVPDIVVEILAGEAFERLGDNND